MAKQLVTVKGKTLYPGYELDGLGLVTETMTTIEGYVTCFFANPNQRPQTFKMDDDVDVWIAVG